MKEGGREGEEREGGREGEERGSGERKRGGRGKEVIEYCPISFPFEHSGSCKVEVYGLCSRVSKHCSLWLTQTINFHTMGSIINRSVMYDTVYHSSLTLVLAAGGR